MIIYNFKKNDSKDNFKTEVIYIKTIFQFLEDILLP